MLNKYFDRDKYLDRDDDPDSAKDYEKILYKGKEYSYSDFLLLFKSSVDCLSIDLVIGLGYAKDIDTDLFFYMFKYIIYKVFNDLYGDVSGIGSFSEYLCNDKV